METTRTSNTIKETQVEIIKILGFDYDIFSSTSCFEQNATDKFSTLSPSESKLLIMRFLNLEKYEDYAKTTKEKLKKAETELVKIETERAYIEKSLDVKDIDETETKKSIGSYTDTISFLEKQEYELEQKVEIKRELDKINDKLSDLNNTDICQECKQAVGFEHKKIMGENLIDRRDRLLQGTKEPIKESLGELLGQLSDLRDKIQENKQNLYGLQRQLTEFNKKLDTETEKLGDVMYRQEITRKQIQRLTRLYEAFSKNGIPSMILENSIPEIEDTANNLLDSIDFNMNISIELQRENKSKEMSDTLDIIISRGKWQMSYFNYSGGERFIIDLVLRLALSIVLLRRNGCSSTTLIIDEGFGSLDSINRQKALKLIAMIHEKFGFDKILIISHVDEVQDSIGEKIKFKKIGNTSQVLL